MTPMESALAAWIAFHAELGVDMETFLLPPATESQLVAVEEVLGYQLPEDLRELYKIANGQWNMFDDDKNAIELVEGMRWAPLFGQHDFMPLEKALTQYQVYLDIYTSDIEFNTKYYAANPDKEFDPVLWEVRSGDPVDEAGWNPKWLTFAGSDANSYSVDMAPPRGGSPGQVVLHGADEYQLQVAGASVTDLMQQAVLHLTVDDEHRFQYNDDDGPYMANVFFNMDWRVAAHPPPEHNEMPAALVEWQHEQDLMRDEQRALLDAWLEGRGIVADQRNSLIQWFDFRFLSDQASSAPLSVVLQIQMQLIAEGKMPQLGAMADGVLDNLASGSDATPILRHAPNLAAAYYVGGSMTSSFGLNMPVEDAIHLFHEYKLASGDWSQRDYNSINALFEDVQQVPIGANNGFSMDVNGAILSVCVSTFDEETYKSDEICHELDLSSY